jgi:hypothetical protein
MSIYIMRSLNLSFSNCCYSNKIEDNKMGSTCRRHEEDGHIVRKPERGRLFERHRHKWEDNIKIDRA